MNFEGVLIASNGIFRISEQLHVIETQERDLNEVPVSRPGAVNMRCVHPDSTSIDSSAMTRRLSGHSKFVVAQRMSTT